MAIHAKRSGLMIGGKIIDETERNWIFQAIDNKKPTVVSKSDANARVFDGVNAVDDAMKWLEGVRK